MRTISLILTLILFHFASAQTSNSECIESYTLSNSESNSDYTYNAQNSITTGSNYKVESSNSEIRMKAGTVIVLKPDTYLKKGSLYLARIEPCTFCELNFSYPKFFTPNDDSYHDYWKVEWSNPDEFSEVLIFDRFGKLIKTLKNINDSWDGKYNSIDITSSDYWFKLMYTDCYGNKKDYKSHFSLKR